jgi:hypothetical protein
MDINHYAAGTQFQAKVVFNAPLPINRVVSVTFSREQPPSPTGYAGPTFTARSSSTGSLPLPAGAIIRCDLDWNLAPGTYRASSIQLVRDDGENRDTITIDVAHAMFQVIVDPAESYSVSSWEPS